MFLGQLNSLKNIFKTHPDNLTTGDNFERKIYQETRMKQDNYKQRNNRKSAGDSDESVFFLKKRRSISLPPMPVHTIWQQFYRNNFKKYPFCSIVHQ